MSAERIRLLKFMTLFATGGTEKQVVTLAGMLDGARYDLRFACLRRFGELLEDLEKRGIPVQEYPVRSFFEFNALRQQIRFARALRRHRVQIVHSYNFYANVFSIPAAKLAGVPCVIASVRDTGVYMNAAQRRVHKAVCRLADRIVVNADAVRRWLIDEGYRPERITVIRNGLQTVARPANGQVRREFGIADGARLVTMVARVNPQKGVEDFIAAAARISQRFPDARFLVVGGCYTQRDGRVLPDQGYPAVLMRQAERHGIADRVVLTGFRTDVPDLLAASSVSVLPSLSEGLPNTILESMAAGVPVVATRVGGIPELIQHGRHGLLVPPRDPVALADAVCAVLADPAFANSLAERARERVTQCYSFERAVRETEDLYSNLLERHT